MKTLIAFAALGASCFAQNWPSFRGPNASGVLDGANLPVTWNVGKNQNIAWKTPIPGLAHASPIIWGNRVYIVTAISSDPKSVFRSGLYGDVEPAADLSKHTWKLYALDFKTGKIAWERTALEAVPRTKRHPKSTFASATPATDGRYLAAMLGSEGLYVFDMNGKLAWKKDLGEMDAGWFFDPDYQWAPASSPIIYKDLVIVQCDNQKDSFVAAYNLKNGREVWKRQRDEIPGWGTPGIHEGKSRAELITNGTKQIRAYDPLTGKDLWFIAGNNSEITATTPISAHDLIFIANGYPPVQPIFAIKAGANGDITPPEGKESTDAIAWSKKRGGPYMPTVLVYGDLLYSCSNNGILTAYQAKTGERVYQQRVPAKGGAYSASPVAADGRLYFASEDGDVHVAKAGATFELLASNPMGEVLMATPAIAKGMLVVRGQHHVFGIAEAAK